MTVRHRRYPKRPTAFWALFAACALLSVVGVTSIAVKAVVHAPADLDADL